MELNDSIEWRICHSVQPQALGFWWKQQPRSLYMLFDSAPGSWKYAAVVRYHLIPTSVRGAGR